MDAPLYNFHDIVLLINAAICLIFVILRFVVSGGERLAGWALSIFFVDIALSSVSTLLLWNIYIQLPHWLQLILPYFIGVTLVIKGPALLFYVYSLTRAGFRLQKKHLWHGLPAVVAIGYVAVFGIDQQDLLFETPNFTAAMSHQMNVFWYGVKLVPVVYGVAIIGSLHMYQQRLMHQFSSVTLLAPGWLQALTYSFVFSWTCTLTVNFLGNIVSPQLGGALGILDNYIAFILVVCLFIYSMSYAHKMLLASDEQQPEPVKAEPLKQDDIEKVRAGIDEMALHLKANINVEQFSGAIGLSARETSSIINKHFGTNFFEFINRQRVEEAKKRLADKQYSHMNISEIYLSCGFNSSSAFQRFFKRITGTTPTAFRKDALVENA